MKLNEILNRFQNVKKIGEKQYQCTCSAHNDSKPSLSITEEDNKILIHCFAGCDTKDILRAVGLQEKDLFNNSSKNINSKVIKEYYYTDENNKPLYKVMRFEPKSFAQAKYNNGNWVFKMTGVRYVIYNLPNVIKSDEIYFVEGEKDADTLNSLGLVATTTIGGASSFSKHKIEYTQQLKNKTIYIIPDNDEAGLKYATTINESLKSIAKSVKILNLSILIPNLKLKSDITDVFIEYGKNFTLKIINDLKSYKIDLSIYQGKKLSLEALIDILDFNKITVRDNEITKDVEITGLPTIYSNDSPEKKLPIILKNICDKYNIKCTIKDIENELILISDINRYNPMADILTKNEWDGQDRFPILFEVLGISDNLSKTLIRKWFWQTTMIVFNTLENPFGIDGVLTLQGPQGIGKTRFIRNIAMNSKWFKEGAIIDLNIKDSIIEATKGFIVEVGELDNTLRKKQSAVKAFLSNTMDEVRIPYGHKSIKKPRRTSFCATVNPQEFLIDDTGNRRFWVIPVTSIDNDKLEALGKEWCKQLWIQAYNEVKDNPQSFRLTPAERLELNKKNNNFMDFSKGEEEITLKMDFSGKVPLEKWNTTEINERIFDSKSSSTIIGRAINKIANKYPEFVKISKTSNGRIYYLPIKK